MNRDAMREMGIIPHDECEGLVPSPFIIRLEKRLRTVGATQFKKLLRAYGHKIKTWNVYPNKSRYCRYLTTTCSKCNVKFFLSLPKCSHSPIILYRGKHLLQMDILLRANRFVTYRFDLAFLRKRGFWTADFNDYVCKRLQVFG